MSAGLDMAGLAAARCAPRDRTPCGRRMGAFRWGRGGGALWLWPAALAAGGPRVAVAAAETRFAGPAPAHPVAAAFWLATAVRQDLWRALSAVPGLCPVVRVAAEAGSLTLTAAALVPPAQAAPGLGPRIAAVIDPARIAGQLRWAAARAAARAPDE